VKIPAEKMAKFDLKNAWNCLIMYPKIKDIKVKNDYILIVEKLEGGKGGKGASQEISDF
jgi:hypothetical protein